MTKWPDMTVISVWVGIAGVLVGIIVGLVGTIVTLLSHNLARRSDRRDTAGSFHGWRKSVADLLDADNDRTKLVGLDELARMIDAEKDDRQPLVDQFCDFLRESCSSAGGDTSPDIWMRAATILRKRLQPEARASWRGAKFNLSRLVLPDTDFSGIDLTGTTLVFDGAKVTGTVRLDRAVFGPDCAVSFSGASCLHGGRLLFSAADFCAGQVDFTKCRFEGGVIDLSTPRRWQVPPLLDEYRDGLPADLLLPSVPDALREAVRHPRMANIDAQSARAERRLRRRWQIPDDEELLALLRGVSQARIIFSSRKIVFVDHRRRGTVVPYEYLSGVHVSVHSFTASGATDLGDASADTSNVKLLLPGHAQAMYLQFGHPEGNDAVCNILRSVELATASLTSTRTSSARTLTRRSLSPPDANANLSHISFCVDVLRAAAV
jgi:hypothetical protein